MKITAHVKTSKSITLVYEEAGEERVKTIKASDDRFSEIASLLESRNYGAVATIFDVATSVAVASEGRVKVVHNQATGAVETYDGDGKKMPEVLSAKIVALAAAGHDTSALEAFWKGKKGGARGLAANPSRNSRRQLYQFIANGDCNITESGHFILYKGINANGLSKHQGNHEVRHHSKSVDGKKTWTPGVRIPMMHTVGEYLEIPREDCTDDPNSSCASGLHATSWKSHHLLNGGKYVELLIDPADVVSVPKGERDKLRCCRYKVLRYVDDSSKVHTSATVITHKKAKKASKVTEPKKATADPKGTKESKVKADTSALVEMTTDRITIPVELCVMANIRPSDEARIVYTDPRSRFLLVMTAEARIANGIMGAALRRPVAVFDETVKTTSRGAVSIRDRILRLASISGSSTYVVKLIEVGGFTCLEVRKA